MAKLTGVKLLHKRYSFADWAGKTLYQGELGIDLTAGVVYVAVADGATINPVKDVIMLAKAAADGNYVTTGDLTTALADYYTKAQVDAIIAGLDATVNSGDADLVKVSLTEVDGVITALTVDDTALDKKFEDYRTASDQEDLDDEIRQEIEAIRDNYLKNEDKVELEGKITTAQNKANDAYALADEAQTAQEVSDAIDAKITALDLDNKYDAKDSAANALDEAKEYADKKLEDFEKAYITADGGAIDKLNEIASWIADDESGAVKIIADVATNAADIKNIKESAPMTSGITAAKVGEYDATKSTVDTNKTTWDLAATAVQPVAISDMMTKTEHATFVAENEVLKSGVSSSWKSGVDTAIGTTLPNAIQGVSESLEDYIRTHGDSYNELNVAVGDLDREKADKVANAVAGNFAGLDANGNLTDSGKKAEDFATSAENGAKELAGQAKQIAEGKQDPITVASGQLAKNGNELGLAEVGSVSDADVVAGNLFGAITIDKFGRVVSYVAIDTLDGNA